MGDEDDLILPGLNVPKAEKVSFFHKVSTKKEGLKFPDELKKQGDFITETHVKYEPEKTGKPKQEKQLNELKFPEKKLEKKTDKKIELEELKFPEKAPEKEFDSSDLQKAFEKPVEKQKKDLVEPAPSDEKKSFLGKVKGFIHDLTYIEDEPLDRKLDEKQEKKEDSLFFNAPKPARIESSRPAAKDVKKPLKLPPESEKLPDPFKKNPFESQLKSGQKTKPEKKHRFLGLFKKKEAKSFELPKEAPKQGVLKQEIMKPEVPKQEIPRPVTEREKKISGLLDKISKKKEQPKKKEKIPKFLKKAEASEAVRRTYDDEDAALFEKGFEFDEKELEKVEKKKIEARPQEINMPGNNPEPEQASEFKFEIDLRPKLIVLPDVKDKTKLNVKYPLIPPYAYAHIFWHSQRNELIYYVDEPKLNEKEEKLLEMIKTGLEEMITVPFTKAQRPKELIQFIEKNVQALLAEFAVPVSKESYLKLMYYVYRNFIGLNEIEPLLMDYYIEDIECNGVNYPVYVVHRKYENLRTNIIYKDVEKLADFVEKLAQKTGRYVSYANPLLDGALPDGSRVNATYTKDITTRGPTFTVRKFTKKPWTSINLIEFGTATPEIFAYLWLAIEHKFNVMVIGETASGKTTFLNTIVHFIPPEARICSIEDTRELNLAHDNWLPSVSRAGFGMPTIAGGERYGEVSLFDLLKETFRQNPDYVIVGEARGAEASVLFQGMASGHPSFSTFHAGSVETFVRRLETPPINLSPSLVEVLDIICICSHVKTRDVNIRRIKAVEEVEKIESDWSKSVINHKFKWVPSNDSFVSAKRSVIFDKICERTGISRAALEKEFRNRAKLLDAMHMKKVMNFADVAVVLNDYYNDSAAVLKRFGVR